MVKIPTPGEDHSSKRKKINYESDEAEDSLVIEEEPLQIDESRCQTDEEDALAKAGKVSSICGNVRKLQALTLFSVAFSFSIPFIRRSIRKTIK